MLLCAKLIVDSLTALLQSMKGHVDAVYGKHGTQRQIFREGASLRPEDGILTAHFTIQHLQGTMHGKASTHKEIAAMCALQCPY